MKYVKKPVIVEAVQWFKTGDHPAVEGDYFVYPGRPCAKCSSNNEHGWVETLEGGHLVCPGDWIITGVEGEHYPCKNRIFKATYEPAE